MLLICDVVLYFVLFAICGWICESIFCSVLERKPVNRGFLNGPVCPVYGFGGLIVIYLLGPLRENLVSLFFFGALACTLLEYATSWLLEKLFHAKWWDYSANRFNINGRVCLSFSLLFGGLSVVAVNLLYPPFVALMERTPAAWKPWLAGGCVAVLAADCVSVILAMNQLNGKLEEIKVAMEDLMHSLENLQGGRYNLSERIAMYREEKAAEYDALRQTIQGRLSRLENLVDRRQKLQHRRLLRAFPNMRSMRNQESFARLKEAVDEFRRNRKR